MTYEELIEDVNRLGGVELANTSPIFSSMLKTAENRHRDDVAPTLLVYLMAACMDLGVAYAELTRIKGLVMEPVVFIPTKEPEAHISPTGERYRLPTCPLCELGVINSKCICRERR